MLASGHLVIKPLTAQLLRDTETFSTMSPYVRVICGNSIAMSPPNKKGGKNPGWKEELALRYNGEELLYIELWNKETFGKDDFIGSGEFPFSSLLASNFKTTRWIPLKYKAKPAGQILLEIELYPDGDKVEKLTELANALASLYNPLIQTTPINITSNFVDSKLLGKTGPTTTQMGGIGLTKR